MCSLNVQLLPGVSIPLSQWCILLFLSLLQNLKTIPYFRKIYTFLPTIFAKFKFFGLILRFISPYFDHDEFMHQLYTYRTPLVAALSTDRLPGSVQLKILLLICRDLHGNVSNLTCHTRVARASDSSGAI